MELSTVAIDVLVWLLQLASFAIIGYGALMVLRPRPGEARRERTGAQPQLPLRPIR